MKQGAKKVLMVSGDSNGKVHFREWTVGGYVTPDWDREFEIMQDHYHAMGHYVDMGFRANNPEFPSNESLITVIEAKGKNKFGFPTREAA